MAEWVGWLLRGSMESKHGISIPAREFDKAIVALVGRRRERYLTNALFHATIYTLALELPWSDIVNASSVARWVADNEKLVRVMERNIEGRLLSGAALEGKP